MNQSLDSDVVVVKKKVRRKKKEEERKERQGTEQNLSRN